MAQALFRSRASRTAHGYDYLIWIEQPYYDHTLAAACAGLGNKPLVATRPSNKQIAEQLVLRSPRT
jgi:hypothetical protein